MDYNFESLANDLIEKFDKKMEVQRKLVNKNLAIIFDFLGDKISSEKKQELKIVIDDLLCDGNNTQSSVFTQTMNKILSNIKTTVK